MTQYLDEYDPKAKSVAKKVQSDVQKLKFNNIQSCIAVVLVPVGRQIMVGVHLTTSTTTNKAELKSVMEELRQAAGAGPCDAYLVSAWAYHAGTDLAKELKKLARAVYLCDVPAKSAADASADVDVKVQLAGSRLQAYVRLHAVNLKDASGRAIVNPDWNRATALPGKPQNLTDRDAKPWMAVAFRPLLS